MANHPLTIAQNELLIGSNRWLNRSLIIVGFDPSSTLDRDEMWRWRGEGRYRTYVLEYPGGATPDAKRQEEFRMRPTVKPVALIADLIHPLLRS
jgi:hypothetical protein